MRGPKSLVCLCAVFGLIGAALAPAQACVGARALAMGGAFTGLADDVSATYWNPAALVDLPADKKHATVMHTANNRDLINYQKYAAVAWTLDEESAVGLSYISFQLIPSTSEAGLSLSWDQNWYWISYARKIGPDLSIGANVRLVDDDVSATYLGSRLPISGDTDTGFDLALYRHASDTVTVGLLIQTANEPESTVSAQGETLLRSKWVRNWRPGVAVRLPDGVVVSAELYDATDEVDRSIRLGVEKKFPRTGPGGEPRPDGYALRAGWYGNADAVTLGAGIWQAEGSADVALLTGDLHDTWIVSATRKF